MRRLGQSYKSESKLKSGKKYYANVLSNTRQLSRQEDSLFFFVFAHFRIALFIYRGNKDQFRNYQYIILTKYFHSCCKRGKYCISCFGEFSWCIIMSIIYSVLLRLFKHLSSYLHLSLQSYYCICFFTLDIRGTFNIF